MNPDGGRGQYNSLTSYYSLSGDPASQLSTSEPSSTAGGRRRRRRGESQEREEDEQRVADDAEKRANPMDASQFGRREGELFDFLSDSPQPLWDPSQSQLVPPASSSSSSSSSSSQSSSSINHVPFDMRERARYEPLVRYQDEQVPPYQSPQVTYQASQSPQVIYQAPQPQYQDQGMEYLSQHQFHPEQVPQGREELNRKERRDEFEGKTSSAGQPEVEGTFQREIFRSRYQRNNKRGGLKNLRCFPSCGFRHKERGFCGRSVEVEVRHPSHWAGCQFYSWVEFVKKDDPPPFNVGDKFSLQKALDMERSKEEPIKPWVRGERLDEKCTESISAFEFNKERRGWHYGWASNKHTCNSEHALQCYLFEATPSNPDELYCRLIFQSPSFMLFCKRRRRFTLAPSAPTAAPMKRSRSSASLVKNDDTRKAEQQHQDEDQQTGSQNTADAGGEESTPSSAKTAPKSSPCGMVTVAPAVFVSPTTRKRQLSNGGAESRLEAVMRRLVLIMGRIQQQQERESRVVRKRRKPSGDLSIGGGPGGDDFMNFDASFGMMGEGQLGDEFPDMDLAALCQVFSENDEGSLQYGGAWDPHDMAAGTGTGGIPHSSSSISSSSSRPTSSTPSSLSLGMGNDVNEEAGVRIKSERKEPEAGEDESGPRELKRTTSDQMVEDVASYVRHEAALSRAVEQLTKQAQNGTPNYQGFLRLVQDHLDSYRRSRNISRAEFDRVFNKYTSKLQTKPSQDVQPVDHVDFALSPASEQVPPSYSSGLFSSALGAFTSFVSSSSTSTAHALSSRANGSSSVLPQPMYLEGPGFIRIPNIQGRWRQTEESEQAMQEMRQKMGMPWILSKMFEFMESRYEIEQHGLEMVTRLTRKWISSTTMRFTLDGDLHHWGISLPGPFSQLSRGWTYRAWVENNKIILSHMIGDQRVTRINWVNRDRSILHSIVILELLDDPATGVYSEMGRVTQHANRE